MVMTRSVVGVRQSFEWTEASSKMMDSADAIIATLTKIASEGTITFDQFRRIAKQVSGLHASLSAFQTECGTWLSSNYNSDASSLSAVISALATLKADFDSRLATSLSAKRSALETHLGTLTSKYATFQDYLNHLGEDPFSTEDGAIDEAAIIALIKGTLPGQGGMN